MAAALGSLLALSMVSILIGIAVAFRSLDMLDGRFPRTLNADVQRGSRRQGSE